MLEMGSFEKNHTCTDARSPLFIERNRRNKKLAKVGLESSKETINSRKSPQTIEIKKRQNVSKAQAAS